MKYLVFTQDEFNNNYFIGIYKDLKRAIPDINDWLEIYGTKIDELNIHSGTYDSCFDKEIMTQDDTCVMIRGFILDEEHLKAVD